MIRLSRTVSGRVRLRVKSGSIGHHPGLATLQTTVTTTWATVPGPKSVGVTTADQQSVGVGVTQGEIAADQQEVTVADTTSSMTTTGTTITNGTNQIAGAHVVDRAKTEISNVSYELSEVYTFTIIYYIFFVFIKCLF